MFEEKSTRKEFIHTFSGSFGHFADPPASPFRSLSSVSTWFCRQEIFGIFLFRILDGLVWAVGTSFVCPLPPLCILRRCGARALTRFSMDRNLRMERETWLWNVCTRATVIIVLNVPLLIHIEWKSCWAAIGFSENSFMIHNPNALNTHTHNNYVQFSLSFHVIDSCGSAQRDDDDDDDVDNILVLVIW